MKKRTAKLFTFLILTLLGMATAAKAQETIPDSLGRIIPVNGQFFITIHLGDTAIWHFKGYPYGYGRLARYKDVLKGSNPNVIGDTSLVTTYGKADPTTQVSHLQAVGASGNPADGLAYVHLDGNSGSTASISARQTSIGYSGLDLAPGSAQMYSHSNTTGHVSSIEMDADGTQGIYVSDSQRRGYYYTFNPSYSSADHDHLLTTCKYVDSASTTLIAHLSDSTQFATYIGRAKVILLRDSIIGGGTPFIKLPKGSNVANGGTVFASNAVDSLWYRQYDKTKGINVQWFGVKGDGTTLNNARLQAAFNMAGNINIPDGNYLVDASRNAVNIKSNTHLVLNKNAVIKTQANNNPYTYQTLYVNQAQNVSIEGGAVEGDKYTHTDTTGQHGFGISVYGSKKRVDKGYEIK